MKQKLTSRFDSFRAATLFVAPAILALIALATTLTLRADDTISPPPLPSPMCDSLQVPAGNAVVFHAYAVGVQIYTWTGTNWLFVAPRATLYADPGLHGQVGRHYLTPGAAGGPTWQSNSGSKVIGKRQAACTPDTSAIPWLKLSGISSQGPGVLDGVTFIQRVNTIAGKAPATPGTTIGQVADVPYAAEYFFYAPVETED